MKLRQDCSIKVMPGTEVGAQIQLSGWTNQRAIPLLGPAQNLVCDFCQGLPADFSMGTLGVRELRDLQHIRVVSFRQ